MMEPRYDIKEVESRISDAWEKSGYFSPDQLERDGLVKPGTEPFSIVLPPPNVTGTLHMGHAAMLVLEDIMTRTARMQGRKTLWLPGTDHAAIATQSKYESIVFKKEGKSRFDIGREEFLKGVEAFAAENHDTIVRQIKRLGSSLDWSREAYTLDAKREVAVRTAFSRLYDMGLIYQGGRIVNWDPKMQTTVSDDEIEWMEEKVPLYYLRYGPFTIATARPETKFGDKYVVMHPDDERYAQYRDGQQIELEWINGPVTATIIKDSVIDMQFGTGVMTITPHHDMTDYDIASRHNLAHEQIIDLKGKLLPIAGEFAGIHIKKARPLIAEKLAAKGLLEKVEEGYTHRIATNSRGGGVIEPQILTQWFIDANKEFIIPRSTIPGIASGSKTSLKKLMRTAVESGAIKILPERFEKIYFHWIDNLRDWCISRQIWFGHRIPVWYRQNKNGAKEMRVGIEAPEGEGWEQDPDTLDTWFSSGLWTFSTLGWPEETSDLSAFHPTSVLETGYDILFFWVARMVLMTGALLGDVPFRTVYLHGLVRDAKGRKMSKSLGNGIDPLEMADKYGADATRMSLVIGAGPGNDIKLSEDKIRGYRNFATKIWNAARFVLMNDPGAGMPSAELSLAQKERLRELEDVKAQVTKNVNAYEFHLAAETLYHYFWHTFADKIIEEEKESLQKGDASQKAASFHLLSTILEDSIAMLHPFMPFVTEEVYQKLHPDKMLMVRQW